MVPTFAKCLPLALLPAQTLMGGPLILTFSRMALFADFHTMPVLDINFSILGITPKMKAIKNLLPDLSMRWLFWSAGFYLSTGCGHKHESSSRHFSAGTSSVALARDERQWSTGDYQRDKEAALRYAAKVNEERLRNPQPTQLVLPNFDSGPGFPKPIGVNFYQINERYPGYLLCTYDVNQNPYDPSKETEQFKAALLQIRGLGPQRFPPIKWVAICIMNAADHKGTGLQQSLKVGAVFSAVDVFDPSVDPLKLIARSEKDLHPFEDDPKGPEQQRWVIVERHAMTN
jgi:hypothetical protein